MPHISIMDHGQPLSASWFLTIFTCHKILCDSFCKFMKHWPRWEVIAQGLRGSVSWGNYTTWDISLWWADRDAQDEPTLATGNICVLNVESSILTHCLVSSGSYLPSVKSDVNTVTGALCFTAQPTSHILCGPGAILSEWLPSFLC